MALLGPQRQDFLERYKFYIEPATDDRPYFFRFFKWSAAAELFALREQGGIATSRLELSAAGRDAGTGICRKHSADPGALAVSRARRMLCPPHR